MTMTFDLDHHIVDLLRDEPFFAALSRQMEKVPTESVPTAGVRFNDERCRFEIYYNPTFMGDLAQQDLKYVKGVLLHEFYHIMLLHVTERMPEGKMSKKWNVATDLAINSELSVFACDKETPTGYRVDSSILPLDKALVPTVGPFEQLPPHRSAEEYMAMLPEEEEKEEGGAPGPDGEPCAGNGFDDHSDWGSGSSDAQRQIAEERMKEALREAYSEAMGKGFGTVSQSMRKTIKDNITPKVNWRAILRAFVKASQRANKASTIKRLNRRYAYIHPGRKVNRQAKIAISIDQSGSVSDQMLAAFYAELEKLAAIAEFTIVPFDSDVSEENIHIWKKGERRQSKRYLSGGTCFNAPTRWVNENKFDGHIILTDLEAPKPIPSICQRMWMTTRSHAERPFFQTNERVIAIDD